MIVPVRVRSERAASLSGRPTMSTATIVWRSGSDSSAIAAYASRASTAACGSALLSVTHSRSSGAAGAERRCAAVRVCAHHAWRRIRSR